MTSILVAADEVAAGRLTAAHEAEAARAVRDDGFVVLEDVIDPAHLDVLLPQMLADVDAILAREDAPFNFTRSNIQQDPPPFPPFLFRDILVNDLVIQITKTILGPGLKNAFYSGNTALRSEERQPVHPDYPQLWSDLDYATPAYALVVNVPVVDMSPENGSTEIWPGTHMDTHYSMKDTAIRIPDDMLTRQRAIHSPLQLTVRRGSAIIRDIRLWHA